MNSQADALSRRAQDELDIGDRLVQDTCLLPPTLFAAVPKSKKKRIQLEEDEEDEPEIIQNSKEEESSDEEVPVPDDLIDPDVAAYPYSPLEKEILKAYENDEYYQGVKAWLTREKDEQQPFPPNSGRLKEVDSGIDDEDESDKGFEIRFNNLLVLLWCVDTYPIVYV